ncbi:hypothetical protein [Kaarinaea lacus]
MNQEQVHALLSKASEAIVSEDGRVQRKIRNYETVIATNVDDPFFIPTGAVNDNYGNLNNYVIIAGKRVAKITVLRYAMYTTFVLVITGFLWSLLAVISPSRQPLSQVETSISSESLVDRSTSALQLERIANLIIRDGDWNEARIKIFLREWNNNNQETKELFKSTAWYQHFSYRLKNKFQQEQNMGVFAQQDNATSTHLIMKLALALGIADPNVNYAALKIEKKEISAIADEVTMELVKLEKEKLSRHQAEAQEAADSEEALNGYLQEALGATTAQSGEEGKNAPVVNEPVPVQNSTTVAMAQPSISDADINRVLEKYTAAYKLGDMRQITSLFGVDGPGQGKQIIAQLKDNYELVFANSKKRSVSFNAINWRILGDRAIVDSDYKADIELKNNKGLQSVNAKAKMELQLLNSELKIERLELLNRKVNVVTPELHLASTNKVRRPDAPTAAELQDILTRLVSAYESGNIKMLTGLFAKDAKTNDQDGLKGIEEDYKQLFSSTTDRQMFIQGIEWSHDKNYAKGSGDLEAIVFAQNGESVYTMKGKIQIVAKRIEDKVLITHLYHIERSK